MPAFKDLLVLVDTLPSCEGRLRLAAALAARYGAHLTGLHVSAPPTIPMLVEAPVAADLMANELRILAETSARAEALFTRHTAASGVATSWRADEGEWSGLWLQA